VNQSLLTSAPTMNRVFQTRAKRSTLLLVELGLGAAAGVVIHAEAALGLITGEDGRDDIRLNGHREFVAVESAALHDGLAGIELDGGRAGVGVVPIHEIARAGGE